MKLSWRRVRIHTRHPFRIARPGASIQDGAADRIIVEISESGISGHGEIAPVPYYGVTLESAEKTLADANRLMVNLSAPEVASIDAASIDWVEAIVDRLLETVSSQRSVLAGIDAALHDWIGKRSGKPCWRLMGLSQEDVRPTSMTIGLGDSDAIADRVREASTFGCLKIKVGTPAEVDTLRMLRQAAPDVMLRVDANCGWSAGDMVQRAEALLPFGLELIEQPLPPGNLDATRALRQRLAERVPLVADEDCVTKDDVDRLVGAYDAVNVKLCKCGGIVEARRLIERARAAGLGVMLGCMIETSLGVAAAVQIASLADYLDIDSHLLLADDPFEGLTLRGDVVLASDQPGMGVWERQPDS